jgi:hypothetical protein
MINHSHSYIYSGDIGQDLYSLSGGSRTRRKNIRSAQTDVQVPTDYISTDDALLEGDGIHFFFCPASYKDTAETCR